LNSVKTGRWKFHTSLFKDISPEAKDFIRKCLTKVPSKRPSSHDMLDHPWFQSATSPLPSISNISLDVLIRLRGFSKKASFTKLCIEVVAHTLRFQQISDLRKEFMKVDKKQLGYISSTAMQNVFRSCCQFNENDLALLCSEMGFQDEGMIQYHEFLAAALSRRIITEENILLAFEKISNHREYITVDDISSLLGIDSSSKEMVKIFSEVGLSKNERLNFEKVSSTSHMIFQYHSYLEQSIMSSLRVL
jgi:calcium-dependent protein kinase